MKGMQMIPDNIRAIEEGRKTVTRRLDGLKEINLEPDKWKLIKQYPPFWWFESVNERRLIKPLYKVGDVVYIKEAWCVGIEYDTLSPSGLWNHPMVVYKLDNYPTTGFGKWRSPLFMPAWVARYFIRILDVRPERLQEITPEDCLREGLSLNYQPVKELPKRFAELWDSINPTHPWAHNDWVWRYEFEGVSKE